MEDDPSRETKPSGTSRRCQRAGEGGRTAAAEEADRASPTQTGTRWKSTRSGGNVGEETAAARSATAGQWSQQGRKTRERKQ